jgi:hypothetical protein
MYICCHHGTARPEDRGGGLQILRAAANELTRTWKQTTDVGMGQHLRVNQEKLDGHEM